MMKMKSRVQEMNSEWKSHNNLIRCASFGSNGEYNMKFSLGIHKTRDSGVKLFYASIFVWITDYIK